MPGALDYTIMMMLPIILLIVFMYVVFRLTVVGKAPESKPGQESHSQLRE